MLKKDLNVFRYLLFALLIGLQGCFDVSTTKTETKNISNINIKDYNQTYSNMFDTINSFWKYKLQGYNFLNSGAWYLDSLLCFNNSNNRFISAILYTNSNYGDAEHDGIQFMYGEKINGLSYFFVGPSIHVPRSMVANQPLNKPLSYSQLHQIALKEVYGGYLNKDGTINEHWFISHFEGNGWGDFYHQDSLSDWFLKGRRFKTEKEYYESAHLDKVRNNWYEVKKDSIKQLKKKDETLP